MKIICEPTVELHFLASCILQPKTFQSTWLHTRFLVVPIVSVASVASSSGAVLISSGEAGPRGTTGDVCMATGQRSSSSGRSGDTQIPTGSTAGEQAGDIILAAGAAGTDAGGSVMIAAGASSGTCAGRSLSISSGSAAPWGRAEGQGGGRRGGRDSRTSFCGTEILATGGNAEKVASTIKENKLRK